MLHGAANGRLQRGAGHHGQGHQRLGQRRTAQPRPHRASPWRVQHLQFQQLGRCACGVQGRQGLQCIGQRGLVGLVLAGVAVGVGQQVLLRYRPEHLVQGRLLLRAVRELLPQPVGLVCLARRQHQGSSVQHALAQIDAVTGLCGRHKAAPSVALLALQACRVGHPAQHVVGRVGVQDLVQEGQVDLARLQRHQRPAQQPRQCLLQGSQRRLVALHRQAQAAALAFEEGAQRPVLAVLLPPEGAAVLQFGNGRQLWVVFHRPQVGAQAAIGHARQVQHRHRALGQAARLAVGHHAQPGARPAALRRQVGAQRKQLRQGRLQLRQHAFPFTAFVGPQNGHGRRLQTGVEFLGLVTHPAGQGLDHGLRQLLHFGLFRIGFEASRCLTASKCTFQAPRRLRTVVGSALSSRARKSGL